jgi:integrase
VVGSGGEDHGQRERLVAASAARSLEQGAPHRSETSVEAERCLDHTGPAPVRGAKTSPRVFNLAIDSKLRGCDLVRLQNDDVCVGGRVRDRATVLQKKTGRPVQFEITEQTRVAVQDWLSSFGARSGRYLFPSRFRERPHISTRQYARIVHGWVAGAGLDSSAYGTHSMRRTKPAQIYKKTGNLRAVQLLLGHTKLESTVRYLGIEVEDALSISEQVEL